MKSLMLGVLLAGQIALAAQPAMAADFGDQPAAAAQQHGAFAGARLRLPLGGAGHKARAGLSVAPIAQGRQADGSVRTRIGEGMELGFAGRDKAELSLAGRPVAQIVQGPAGPDGEKLGTSTGKGLLIVGGIVVLTLGALALLLAAQ